jgi:hypothetical protein
MRLGAFSIGDTFVSGEGRQAWEWPRGTGGWCWLVRISCVLSLREERIGIKKLLTFLAPSTWVKSRKGFGHKPYTG